jgi:hypothetical protein
MSTDKSKSVRKDAFCIWLMEVFWELKVGAMFSISHYQPQGNHPDQIQPLYLPVYM